MRTNHFDVIVIGAGPSGAAAALDLANAGAKTLLVEKQKLPRHKTCGGGLTHKVAAALPLEISSAVERTITSFVLSYRMGRPRTLHSREPLVYMVRRSEFDHFLTSRAVEAGAELVDDTKCESILPDDQQVCLTTSRGTYTSDVLIGADGATGITARSVGLMSDRVLLPAIEHEVEVPTHVADEWQGKLGLDLGTVRASYGWVFPKEDHFNVGVGGFGHRSDFSHHLKRYDAEHLKRRVPERIRVRKTFGYVLPLRRKDAPIQKGRVLLVGDAAGLVEALTGEGIYYAVRSGQLAAQAIVRNAHTDYQKDVDQILMPVLLIARHYAALYRWLPGVCYFLGLHFPTAWAALRMALRGDNEIWEVRRKLGLLTKLIDLLPAYA